MHWQSQESTWPEENNEPLAQYEGPSPESSVYSISRSEPISEPAILDTHAVAGQLDAQLGDQSDST